MEFDNEKNKLLDTSKSFLHDIINNMVDPVFVKDDKSRLVLVNDSFCSIFNVPKDMVIGKTLAEHVPENEREQFFRVDNEVLSSGKEDVSQETLTINGETSIIITKKNRFVSESGDRYLLGSIHDITKIKQAEKTLVEGQRLAAMGEMASSIAHDFNNSLQALLGNIEVAKLDQSIPLNVLECFERVESIVFDVKGRVKSLQKFGNVSHEKEMVEDSDVNLLLQETIDELRPIWKNDMERIGVSVEVLSEFKSKGVVSANKGDLKTVFYNLMKNAVESVAEKKEGEIKISTSNDNEHVLIHVEDNGCGMTESTVQRVFNPFFTTKGLETGRGLGMSGVYGVVQSIGGKVSVKKTIIDKGTVFEIALPLSKSINIKAEGTKVDVVIDKSLNVLWVEDDAIIGMNAQALVESFGCTCEVAESADEAIKMMKESTFDYVVTDIGLGGMSGLELSKHIKENHKNIKVAVVSGWKVTDEEKEDNGVCCAISKPFNMSILKECFQKLQNN